MLKLCRVDIERSEEIFERIKRYKDVVIERLNPKAVILFGSFALGEINEGSDVDIAVIDELKKRQVEKLNDELEHALGIEVDLKLFKDMPDPVKFEVLAHGMVFADDQFRKYRYEFMKKYLDFVEWWRAWRLARLNK